VNTANGIKRNNKNKSSILRNIIAYSLFPTDFFLGFLVGLEK
jgi:hypothetical protein